MNSPSQLPIEEGPLELASLDRDHMIPRAMRRIARYWPLAYSKLLCLGWRWSRLYPYGATDDVDILLNPEGVDQLYDEGSEKGDGVGGVAFLLLHEGAHAFLNHGSRLSKLADPEAANRAADYKVNEMIWQRNVEVCDEYPGEGVPFPIPEGALLDLTMSSPHTTEKLYQYIRKQPETNHVPDRQQSTDTPPPDDTSQHPDGDPPVGGDSSDDYKEDPLGSSSIGDSRGDDRSRPDGDGGVSDPGSGSPDPGDGVGTTTGGGSNSSPRPGDGTPDTFAPVAKVISQEELERSLEEQNERLMFQDTVDSCSSGSGSALTKRIAEERGSTSPQDWVSYAEQFVEARCEDGWMAPYNHEVYITTGMCAPGREGKKVGDIVVVVDSSGSIGPEAWKRFFELNQHILDEVQPERLLLVSCAEEVKDHVILEQGDTVPRDMNGGGGTSFKKAFDWVQDDPDSLCIDPLLLIYFTDGWASDHKTMPEPAYPVLWLSYSKPKEHFPWGEFAEITLK